MEAYTYLQGVPRGVREYELFLAPQLFLINTMVFVLIGFDPYVPLIKHVPFLHSRGPFLSMNPGTMSSLERR